MIIVDDRLSLDVLAGRLREKTAFATTWGFHYRLVRALSDPERGGSLSRLASPELIAIATHPPEDRLVIVDPRELTSTAVALAVRHGLNLLAAEAFAAASTFRAELRLSANNVGRSWPGVMRVEKIRYKIIE